MNIGFDNMNVCNELERLLRCFKSDDAKLDGIRPESILIYGIKGVGKTSLVHDQLGSAGLDYTEINPGMVSCDTTYIEFLNKVAEGGCADDKQVIVIDNLESLVSADDAETQSATYLKYRSFISRVIDNGILVIAIVDDPLDCPKYIREIWNFEYRIEVPWLRGRVPYRISQEFWKGKLDDTVDESAVASVFSGLTPDLLEQIYRQKCMYEIGDSCPYEYERILNAAVDVLFGIPYMLSEAPDDIRNGRYEAAVYEAGRIVVSEITNPGSVRLSTIHHLPGTAGGRTLQLPPMDVYPTMKREEHEVMYLLSGKAAIDVVYGQAAVGCRRELDDAARIVYDLESRLCPYDFEVFPTDEPSGNMQEMLESAVSATLKSLYSETCKIIRDNRGFLDAVVNHLADRYTITQREIARLSLEYPKKRKWSSTLVMGG